MTDSEILKLMESDPSQGIGALVDVYSPLVYTVVYSKLGQLFQRDDIEEFVSCVFAAVYEKHDSIDLSRGSLKGYISTVAKRMSIDEYRRQTSRVKTVSLEEGKAEELPDIRDMQEDVERRMDEAALAEALGRLCQEDRTVLVRKYYHNQTSSEIAKAMHMTDAAVRKRISRAIDKLRTIMRNQGGALT